MHLHSHYERTNVKWYEMYGVCEFHGVIKKESNVGYFSTQGEYQQYL